MYIRLIDGKPQPYSVQQLRSENPQVSFPDRPSLDLLASYDIYPLMRAAPPAHDPLRESVRMVDPAPVDGVWTQQWEILPLPASTILENMKAARAEAYKTESDPLFFKAQRGEATMDEWSDKVSEIKDRYPYPEG